MAYQPLWDPFAEAMGLGLGTHNDPFAASGIVTPKATTRSSGKTQSRVTDFVGYKSRKRNRSAFEQAYVGSGSSLSAAQKAAQSFTKQERKTKKPGDKMGRYAPGTLGRKYKPDFKKVKIGPRTSRLRYVDHNEVTGTNAVYTAFNDVGPVEHLLRSAAEATLLYYMSKAGDVRSNQRDAVVGIADELVTPPNDGHQTTWGKMVFLWRDRIGLGGTTTEAVARDVLYHFGDGAEAVGTIHSFAEMSQTLTNIFKERSETHDLASVTIFEPRGTLYNHDGGLQQRPIYHDPDAGRHKIMFTAKAKFKVQNTTLADTNSDQANKDNIHANPLDGLVYKFRNRVPLWAPGFIGAVPETDANILNNFENVQTSDVTGVRIPGSLSDYEWFKVPPPAPYTLFKNSAGRSKILIKPGEHRVIKLNEDFEGSINSFFKKYCPAQSNSRTVPPGGNCIVIGLKPTFRTGSNEDLEIQTEIDRYFQSVLVPRKLTPMPITNILS